LTRHAAGTPLTSIGTVVVVSGAVRTCPAVHG
jgi:hypothetical protein